MAIWLRVFLGLAIAWLGSASARAYADDACFGEAVDAEAVRKVLSSAVKVVRDAWDGDGQARIVLTHVESATDECTQLVVIHDDQRGNAVRVEVSGALGSGKDGCCKTDFTVKNHVATIKTSEMRNETSVKVRYDKTRKRTYVIGKDVEYYPSGPFAGQHVSINYSTRQKVVTSIGVEQGAKPKVVTKPLTHGPTELKALDRDSLFDDAGT
jgi:hypothetical protein